MYVGEVLIWNDKECRVASLEEIGKLELDGNLFVNYYMVGSDIGRAFVDVEHEDFHIEALDNGSEE